MKKKVIRINEGQLRKMIRESVERIINENKNQYINTILDTLVDYDELLSDSETCIASDMRSGEYFDVMLDNTETPSISIYYNGSPYTDNIEFNWTGNEEYDIRKALGEALSELDDETLDKMAGRNLWENKRALTFKKK